MLVAAAMTRAIVLMLSMAAGCTSSPLVAQLEACELVSEGEVGPLVTSAFYAPTDCYRACLGGASCAELNGALCGSIELLRRCDEQCAHRCDDGALIAVEGRCDGFAQCAGGEDEAGCPAIACNDGTQVTGRRCDGYWNCSDGTDEAGCPTCEAVWGGTTTIYPLWICDGYAQCADEADERGCPVHLCDDGTTITYAEGTSPRCDGRPSCADGSDERGCAALTASCAP